MLEKKLSVIIPCYNCQETLAEAVESVYRQDLDGSFEIVMVNDASTDRTREVMSKLAAKHPEIKLFDHPKNMGGGATRNTAVEKSKNDIIFCLDSDDMLGDETLAKMFNFLIEKNCDAVGISTSIKFKKRNIKDIAFTNNFGYVGEKIPFESLFEKKDQPLCSLYSTFMFTKKAFVIAGGYPTNHGFDTQCFAWRFLANGLTAHTCPETTYLHRINFGRSYYIREYESGKLSHNWLRIYEEFLFLFNDHLKKEIIDYDPNNNIILNEYVNSRENVLVENYQKLLVPGTKDVYAEKVRSGEKNSPFDHYWLGAEEYNKENYSEAKKWLVKSVENGLDSPEVYFKLYDSLAKINKLDYLQIAKKIEERYSYKKQGSLLPFHKRLLRKISREIRKRM